MPGTSGTARTDEATPRQPLRRRMKRVGVDAAAEGRPGPPGFGLYLTLVVFTLLSVPNRIAAIGAIRPSVLLILLISLLIAVHGSYRKQGGGSSTMRNLNLLIVYVLLAIPFVEWPGSVVSRGLENFLKAAVFFYFTVFLVDGRRRLKILIFVVLGCQVFRVLEPLYLHLTTGYWGSRASMGDGQFLARLGGGPHDYINPNGLAFVILTALPFLHYLWGASSRKLLKILYLAILAALLYAFVLTGSRSGLVGLVVVVATILWRSPHRAALTVGVAVASVAMVAVMSGDMRERYLSLTEEGTRHSQTREGRLEGTRKELEVGLRRPIVGHGLGTSAEAMYHFGGHGQIAHNLYTETLIEIGFVGLVLYLWVLASILHNVWSVGRAARTLDTNRAGTAEACRERLAFLHRMADATFVWVAMCLVFSLASYGLSEFYWYLIAGISVCLARIMSQEVARSAPAPGAGDPAPPELRRA